MKYWLVLVAALLATSSAVAQEHRWDGWFAGLDAGYIYRTAAGATMTVDYQGATAGAVVGHWWLIDPITLGFDLGVSLAGANATYATPGGGGWRYETSDVATLYLRAKIGKPIGDTLLYVAAGPQSIHAFTTSTWIGTGPGVGANAWQSESGYTLSAGAEHRMTHNLSLKVEAGYNTVWSTRTIARSGWSGKLGLNYYFN